MAITTQGHQVSVMPQYTPVDPSLIAFNPTQVTDGILSSFQLKDRWDRMKAFKAAQKELADTADKRVKATNAGYDASMARDAATVALSPQDVLYKTGLFNQNMAALPMEGLVRQSQLEGQVERGDLSNTLALGDLQAKYTTMDDDIDTRINTSKAANVASKGAPMEAEKRGLVVMQELQSKLDNAKSDKERLNAYEDARLKLTEANAENALAEADYRRAGGSQQNVDWDARTERKIASLQRSVDAMDKKVLPNGKTLNVYIAEVYEPDGTPKTNWLGNPIPKDQDGEKLLKNRMLQQKRLDEAIEEATNPPQARSMPQVGGVTPITLPGMTVASPVALPQGVAPQAPAMNAVNEESLQMLSPQQASLLPAGTPFIGQDGVKRIARGPRK